MTDGKLTLSGAKDIARGLNKVSDRVARNIGNRAARQAANVVASAARSNVRTSQYGGSLTRLSKARGGDIIVRLRKPKQGVRSARVGIRRDNRPGGAAPYANIFEFGSKPHDVSVKTARSLGDGVTFYGKTVSIRGITAIRFMTRAIESTATQTGALEAMARELRKGIARGA